MRHVSVRNTPRSSGTVAFTPSRCWSTLAFVPGGCVACETCGQLERVAEQDQVPRRGSGRERVGERELARFVDHEVVERVIELLGRVQPRRAGDEVVAAVEALVVVGDVHDLAAVGHAAGRVLGSRLPRAPERQLARRRRPLGLGQQVVDRPMAERRHAHAMPVRDQVDDQACTGIRLAGARRALDEQVAAVERACKCLLRVEICRLDARPGGSVREPWEVRGQHLAQRRVPIM